MRELDWHECYSKNLKGIISNEAFSHPAKFAYGLIVRIYAHLLERGWLREGDLVTDPFAGVGIGGIVAAANGLRWIGIELEQKFVDLTVGFDCDGVVERHQERVWIGPQPSGWFVRLRIKAQYWWDASGETGFGGPRGDGWATEEEAQAFADSIADSEEVQGYPLSTLYWEPTEGHYATEWVCDKPAKCGSREPHDPHHVTGSFELHREQWEKMGKPFPIILQGDSRHFNSIIREAIDSIVTSAPYATVSPEASSSGINIEKQWQTYRAQGGGMSLEKFAVQQARHSKGYGQAEGQIGAMREGKQDEVVEGIVTSAPFLATEGGCNPRMGGTIDEAMMGRHAATHKRDQRYGRSEGQLGGMPEGDQGAVVSAIVTSPTYAESLRPETEEQTQRKQERIAKAKTIHDGRALEKPSPGKAALGGGYGVSKGQLGAMKEGNLDEVVAVITSPAYARDTEPHGDIHHREGTELPRRAYGQSEGQIGHLREGDHEATVQGVVTSAPYVSGGTHPDQTGAWGGKRQSIPKELAGYGKTEGQVGRMSEGDHEAVVNGESQGQIGSEQGDTYWQAVARVYSECFKALKPNGIICVVVKDFVRNKKRVPLCSQTLELLQAIGFKPLERIRAWVVSEAEQKSLMPDVVPDYRKARKSFFRRLAERKGSPRIDWEEVMICQKPD